MLQRKIFGTPGPRAGNYKGGQPQPSHKEVAAMTAGYVMPGMQPARWLLSQGSAGGVGVCSTRVFCA